MDKVFLNSFYAKEYPVVVMDKNGCKITMVTRPYDHVVYYKVEFGGKTHSHMVPNIWWGFVASVWIVPDVVHIPILEHCIRVRWSNGVLLCGCIRCWACDDLVG